MTGGKAVILGLTGRNFAAGMSGGLAFIYDKCVFKQSSQQVFLENKSVFFCAFFP